VKEREVKKILEGLGGDIRVEVEEVRNIKAGKTKRRNLFNKAKE